MTRIVLAPRTAFVGFASGSRRSTFAGPRARPRGRVWRGEREGFLARCNGYASHSDLGRSGMADEEVTPQVGEQAAEAEEAHAETAEDQAAAWSGEGNQPAGTGYAPPDTGAGE